MLLVLELDVADLAATRFAISPLCETLRALALLGRPDPPSVNLPWVRWARGELERLPLRLPRLWPLVVTHLPYWPEFLVPAPTGKAPGFEEELAHMYATPDEPVRASLRRVFGAGQWPDTAKDLLERPRESLAEIAAELTDGHERLIVPHWERIRSVLDADVAYHAGLLASAGARSLFGDLHPDLRWSEGKLFMTDTEDGLDRQITLGPDGLVLVPSVFTWPEWSVKKSTSTQTTLLYPARGVARVWDHLDPGSSGRGGRSGGGRGAARRTPGPAAQRAALPRHHQRAGRPFRRHAGRRVPAPGGAVPRRARGPAAQRADRALPGLRAWPGAAAGGGLDSTGRRLIEPMPSAGVTR